MELEDHLKGEKPAPWLAPRPLDPSALPGTLSITGSGFAYQRDGRTYCFFPDHRNRNSHIFDVEADIGGRRFYGTADIAIAFWRRDFAMQVAGDDRGLEKEVRRDLNLARFKIQLEMVRLELGPCPAYEPAAVDEALTRELRELPVPKEPTRDLAIFSVPESIADELAEHAIAAGGRVRTRGAR